MKRVVVLLLIAVAFAGCQKPKESTRVSVGGNVRSNGLPAGSTSTPSGIQLNAAVTSSTAYQNDFQEGVRDLLEAQVPRDYVGSVSADASNGTGVYIGGRVELMNGQRIGAMNGVASIAPNSELLVTVFDSFYTQQNLDPIPPIYFKQATGSISGNYVTIKFYDSYGYVEMVGQYDSSNFRGDFKYKTERTHDGQPGWSGTLGSFSVPTCSFFRCQ